MALILLFVIIQLFDDKVDFFLLTQNSIVLLNSDLFVNFNKSSERKLITDIDSITD